ncbi:MAG: four helix bundle protein [Nitrospirota bacterium]
MHVAVEDKTIQTDAGYQTRASESDAQTRGRLRKPARGEKKMSATKGIDNADNFEIYRFVFETAIEIFEEIFEKSRTFPTEKRFLTDQIRKYSRSVCTNLAEAWHMKKNRSSFINKLSDAAQAASKTQLFLQYASKCNYVDCRIYQMLDAKYEDIFAILCDLTRS